MKTRTKEEDDSDISGLGALILAIFATISLLLGALMTWLTAFLLNKYVFAIDNPYLVAGILAVWTGLAFAMTPTFGNARRVKSLFSKKPK